MKKRNWGVGRPGKEVYFSSDPLRTVSWSRLLKLTSQMIPFLKIRMSEQDKFLIGNPNVRFVK